MKKYWQAVCVMGLMQAAQPSVAHAESIDMAAIDCRELLTMSIERVVVVGVWMSGYFNAKADNTVLETDRMDEIGAALGAFCEKNPDTTLMVAVEQLFVSDD